MPYLSGFSMNGMNVPQWSRGPWFRKFIVEDDGLDWFYAFLDNDGNKCFLVSNNIPIRDRTKLSYLYHTNTRNNQLSWAAGLWFGFELVSRNAYFRQMALGWRFCSWLGVAYFSKQLLMSVSADNYAPTIGAYLRKYDHCIKRDIHEIKDEKREYFYIDTSQYMNYQNSDLSDEYHVHHGPQPVSTLVLFIIFIYRKVKHSTAPG